MRHFMKWLNFLFYAQAIHLSGYLAGQSYGSVTVLEKHDHDTNRRHQVIPEIGGEVGQNVTLNCSFRNETSCVWKRNNGTIKNGKDYSYSEKPTVHCSLLIISVSHEDFTTWSCENPATADKPNSTSFQLRLVEKKSTNSKNESSTENIEKTSPYLILSILLAGVLVIIFVVAVIKRKSLLCLVIRKITGTGDRHIYSKPMFKDTSLTSSRPTRRRRRNQSLPEIPQTEQQQQQAISTVQCVGLSEAIGNSGTTRNINLQIIIPLGNNQGAEHGGANAAMTTGQRFSRMTEEPAYIDILESDYSVMTGNPNGPLPSATPRKDPANSTFNYNVVVHRSMEETSRPPANSVYHNTALSLD